MVLVYGTTLPRFIISVNAAKNLLGTSSETTVRPVAAVYYNHNKNREKQMELYENVHSKGSQLVKAEWREQVNQQDKYLFRK